jgi:drug/metabolite transporter (DMT)-like permease
MTSGTPRADDLAVAPSATAAPGRATTTRLTDLGVLGVAVVWGSTYVAMQELGLVLSVAVFLALRFSLGALLVTAAALRAPGRLTRLEVALGAQFGVLLAAILALETAGVRYTSASNSGFLIALSVLVVPLVERYVLRRHVPRTVYVCILLGIAGTGLLTLGSGVSVRSGDLIIIAAAAIRGVQIVMFGRRSGGAEISLLRVTAVELWVVGALGLAVAAYTPADSVRQVGQLDALGWAILIYLAVVATGFAFLMQLHAARVGSPTRVGIILSTEPIFAALCAIVLAGDRLSPLQWAGGLVVVAAVTAGRLVERRSTAPVPADPPA